MHVTRWILATLLSITFVACGPKQTGGDVDAQPSPVVALAIAPLDQTLELDGVAPVTSAYVATATFADGHTEDVSARATFTLSNAMLGTFAANTFQSSVDLGGRSRVVATLDGAIAETGLTVVMKARHSDPNSPGLPADPAAPFEGPADASRAPDLVYPNDGVLVPPNLRLLEIHFLPGANNTLFEISFTNELTDVRVYARCAVPMNGGCIYTPDASVWRWLAETNRGGMPLAIGIRGTDDNGTGVGSSTQISLGFSFEEVKGGIYYWKAAGGATSESAVMRFDFGNVMQTTAERFVGPDQAGGKCVGCHALSRDGTKLVASAGGWDVEDSLLVDVETATRVATPGKTAFASWNPDGTKYVGVFAFTGTPTHNLMLFDSAGTQTGTIDVGATAAASTSHPDWSADGSKIAFVHAGQAYEDGVNNQRFYQGAIRMVTDQGGGTFGAPTTIVPAVAGKNRYYPSFAPGSNLLAFNESTCPTGSAHIDCNADSDPTATIFVTKPEAGATPIALARANAPGKADTGTALTNSWPKWAPFDFQRTTETGSKLVWMTFSSTRKYGLRSPPAGTSPETASGTLLWMVAIDPDKALADQDPSYPAFCLPFQDVASSNHIAQWTEEVVVLQKR